MSTTPLTIALIGCGQIADAHLHAIGRLSGARVAAVCDRQIDVARQAAARFGVPAVYHDAARLLADVRPDVVHITTPPHSHRSLVLQALAAGANVYVEKPFTVDLEEAEEIVAVAEARGLRVCLGHDQLFDPVWVDARTRIARGEIGEIVHVEAVQGYDLNGPFGRLLKDDPDHWVHSLPGGLFQNVTSHALARILDFVKDDAFEVQARWTSNGCSFPTEMRALLFGPTGTGLLNFTSAARPSQKIARVFGTKQALEIDLDARTVTAYRSPSLPGALAKVQLSWRRFSEAAGNVALNLRRLRHSDLHFFEGMRTLVDGFYDSIRTGATMPITHAEALRLTRTMDAIFRACRHQQSPSVPAAHVREVVTL